MLVHPLPDHVAANLDVPRLLYLHGVLKMAVAGPASQLGLRHHVGEVLRAVAVVLKQADGSIGRATGNEDTADPIIEMGGGEFVWIGSVGRKGLDALASHQPIVQSRVGKSAARNALRASRRASADWA
jgi:hypothetical protein